MQLATVAPFFIAMHYPQKTGTHCEKVFLVDSIFFKKGFLYCFKIKFKQLWKQQTHLKQHLHHKATIKI